MHIKVANCSVTISGVVPRNNNINNKALEFSQQLFNLQCAKKQNLIIQIIKNINLRTHLNKNRLHVNRYGSVIIGKNFVNFVSDIVHDLIPKSKYRKTEKDKKQWYRKFHDS